MNTYMTEAGGKDRDETLAASVGVNNVSGALAFFVANIVALGVHQLPREMQLTWAWRLPFLLAAPLGIASVMMRRGMAETEAFEAMKDDVSRRADAPAAECDCLANAKSTILVVVVLAAINSCNYLPVYLASWLQKSVGFSASRALALAAVSKVVQVLLTFPVSFVADSFGPTSAMMAGGLGCIASMLPALLLVLGISDVQGGSTEPTTSVYVVIFLVLGLALPIPVAFYNIPCPLFMTSLFPAQFRARGAGLGLGLASLAGGFTPMICSALEQRRSWLPGLFVTLLAIPSLAALAWSRRAASHSALPIYQRPWLF